jgi:DNA-binding GntR family transcriptional regulator
MNVSLIGSDSIPRRSLHDELTERIRALITRGDLSPGEKIPEKELCAQFGVSRTPLREALKVLASEGIITLRPNRGATVSSISVDELEEVFPVLGALEALSGEIACQQITDREVAAIRKMHVAMVAHWKRSEIQPYFRLNQRIHEAILEATRNETLQTIYRGLAGRLQSARFSFMAQMSPERWAKAVEEHEAMIKALEARDGAKLSKILKTHLANKLVTVKGWVNPPGR